MDLVVDICIIGGGVAGLTLARKLAQGGASVAILERAEFGRGASFAAAGMLAPLVEARVEERAVVGFSYEALRYYPSFVEELQGETGLSIDYRSEGTLNVALDRDHAEQLRHQFDEQRELGLPVEWMSGYDCRQLEPCLAPGIPGGIFSPHDHQVDNRLLIDALCGSCMGMARVRMVGYAGEGRFSSDRASFHTSVATVSAGTFVIATGANASLLESIAPELARAIHPVKGQIVRLDQSSMPLVGHVVRTPEVYVAPKSGGMLVVGATSEDRGFDETITAGGLLELLRAAWECLPGIYELPVLETRVGFRPATIDHAPMLGSTGIDRIAMAAGYFRHGILFAPYAAEILAASLLGGERSPWLDSFTPERFHEPHAERGAGA
jgi:glycine oxidase